MSRDLDDDRPRRSWPNDDDGPPRSNGLATAALVLGIVSLCLGVLTGIPAIICGILGLSRSSETRTGQGPAIAGLVLGGLGTLWTALSLLLLLPAVSKVREAAARAKDANNLKQNALAVLNDEAVNHDRLTPPFARDRDGEPNRGLSWRVGVLPYLDQDPLYRRFKLNEAWDSPANRPASQTVVLPYLSANDPPDNQTRFRVFVGPGTLFEDSPEWREKASVGRIRDGAANTLMAVETADRVPWAAPQDIPYQPGGPLPALGHPSRRVFLAMMAYGSVRSVNKAISPQVLHALITRAGGETLPADWDQ